MSETGIPENWEDMTEAEREAWADERKASLDAAADDAAQLSDSERAALDALSEPEKDTATVTINGQTLAVKTYLDADHEDALDMLASDPSTSAARETIAETLAWLIEDDRYGGDTGRKVWRAFAETYGTAALTEAFMAALEPVFDRMEGVEAAEKFRPDGPGTGTLPSRE